ncbi:MAG: transposase [Hyphomicrobiales bacterium]|nr:transposase [Hyphomicrobiales bacterium]
MGRSKGGLTSKIVALVDALGNLVRFVVQPGQRNDIIGVKPLIEGISFNALLADKAFDADWLRKELDERGAMAVIPPRSNRKVQCTYDKIM